MFFPWGGDSTRASLLWHLDTQSPVLQKAREYPSLRLAPSCTLSIRFVVAPTSARRTHTHSTSHFVTALLDRHHLTHHFFHGTYIFRVCCGRNQRQLCAGRFGRRLVSAAGFIAWYPSVHLCCVCNTPVFVQSSFALAGLPNTLHRYSASLVLPLQPCGALFPE